jgi:acyl carrier protein
LKDKVIGIISKAAKIDAALLREEPDGKLWDSLTHLEIIFLLEEAFDIQLETDDIVAMRSLNEVIKVLTRILENKK